ncbi:MAG: magnesium transporter [Tenericutes bacterium HGW-Tenericutes-1]|jgi:magnesium transporter|nr:MAG: magnesium transporter [Tenericutes bacterium HGW-Tenericutes-1]
MDTEKIINEAERDFVEELISLFNEQLQSTDFVSIINEYHPYDIAQALFQVNKDIRLQVFNLLPIDMVAGIFERFDNNDQIEFIKEVPSLFAVNIIDHMNSDDAVDLLQYLEDTDEDYDLVNLLSPKKRLELKKLWNYKDDEIGSSMSNSFIELSKSMTVKEAMKKVTTVAADTEYISILYVVEKHKLVGYLKLKDLIIARASQLIGDIMESRVISAHPHDDKESVAQLIQDYGVSSLPIIDEEFHMIGLVTYDDLMDIISESKSEDYAKFAALSSGDIDHKTETVLSSVKKRLPWLSILLGLSMVTSIILTLFEGILTGSSGAKILAAQLAIYLPLILGMSGNTGTQSLAVMIRFITANKNEISNKQINRHLLREIGTGLVEGLIIASLVFCIILVTAFIKPNAVIDFRTILTATVTSSAIMVAFLISTVLGALIPLIMIKFKFDPAVASGPFITTLSDIVTLTLYYSISLTILLPYYI